jgi:outer membrane lipoprotein carrier protein
MTAYGIASRRTVLGLASVWLLSFVGSPSAFAQTFDLDKTLKGIENRYNSIQSLELQFSETYTMKGHKRAASGTLFLRKPGRMRWQYTEPAGRLFISDGQYIYDYNPEDGQAERRKVKEADDFRAPLAFLLGKLNFKDDFREFHTTMQGQDALITAIPKSDKLPYTEVTFLAAPDFTIKQLSVKGQEGFVIQYTFSGEKKNAPVTDAMFKFTPPPGVQIVDTTAR